jgi:hypothetical protein
MSEPIRELIDGTRKSGFEGVDVILRTRFIDPPVYKCQVEAATELVGASLQSLEYGANLTVGNPVGLSLYLRVHAYSPEHY